MTALNSPPAKVIRSLLMAEIRSLLANKPKSAAQLLRRDGPMLFVPVKLGRCCLAAAHDPGPRPGPSGAPASARVALGHEQTPCPRPAGPYKRPG